MKEFEHLTEEKIEQVINGLWEVESSLQGLARLFQYKEEVGGVNFDSEEFFGVGQLLKVLSRQIETQEDILKYGFNSMAITENSIDQETAKKKLESGDCIKGGQDNFEDGK